jgi:hypothetical protein
MTITGLFFIVVDSNETVTLITTNGDDFSVREDKHVASGAMIRNMPGAVRAPLDYYRRVQRALR